MFSGFDDAGWWLEVQECWGGRSPPGLVGKQPDGAVVLAGQEERERRERM